MAAKKELDLEELIELTAEKTAQRVLAQIAPQYYTAEMLAEMLAMSVRSLKRWVQERKFPQPCFSDGNWVRWSHEQYVGWIKEMAENAQKTA